jgi:hypothetical protein
LVALLHGGQVGTRQTHATHHIGFKEMQRLGELKAPNSPEIHQKKLPESKS